VAPATADSSPQAVTCQHCDNTTLVGLEPTTFRLLVRRATSSATDVVSVLEQNEKFLVFQFARVVSERCLTSQTMRLSTI